MDLGGIGTRERSLQILRYAGFVVPILLTFYGLLVRSHVVLDSYYKSDLIFFSLMSAWVVLGTWQLIYTIRTMRSAYIRLGLYHIFGALYFIFVTGFSTPLVQCWSLLILATFAFFSYKGFILSTVVLFLTATVDTALHYTITGTVLANASTLLSALVISFSIVALTHVQEIDTKELERSQSEEALQRVSILTLINNLADAVISTDRNGFIKVYNAASLDLLDTNDNLIGKSIDDVVRIKENDTTKKFSSLLRKAKGVEVNDSMTMTIGDEEVRLELTYSPIRSTYGDNKPKHEDGHIIILRDITKTKSLEEERDEFISVVSHELRTPITIAEGTISNAQLMFERKDIDNKLLRQGLNTAHEQVVFLAKMVNDLSTLSRAERGVADTPEDIDVKTLVHDLYNEYQPEAADQGLKLDLNTEGTLGTVTTSRLYLHELLQNFITNAIKYTKEGTVTLNVSAKDGKIHFSVHDTGIGISKSDQAKIFHKFYRSEDYRTRETGGTGLGLYVAAKLAKKIGCKIKLESRLNHGSTFGFSLPKKKA